MSVSFYSWTSQLPFFGYWVFEKHSRMRERQRFRILENHDFEEGEDVGCMSVENVVSKPGDHTKI